MSTSHTSISGTLRGRRRHRLPDRLLAGVRRALVMRWLPPRRLTSEEVDAFGTAVANDPEIDRLLNNLLAERPQFRRKRAAEPGVPDRAER
jgi:hypothetical protein